MIVTAHEQSPDLSFRERRARGERRITGEKRSNEERRSWQERRSGKDRRMGARGRKAPHRRSGEDRRTVVGEGQTADRRIALDARSGADRRDREGRLAFLGIDDATADALRDLQPLVAAHIDAILDDFYAHLMKNKELAALFGKDGPGHARVQQRRYWLEHLFAGVFDDAYMQRAAAVGRSYERMGLEPRWFVAAYCFILNRVIDLAVEVHGKTPDRLNAVLQAVTKAMFLDLDLGLSSQVDAMKQSVGRRAGLSRDELAALLEGD